MMDKRLRKIAGLHKEVTPPWLIERTEARAILIGWGSTFGAIKEAADLLEKEGTRASILQLPQVWPFPTDAVTSALKSGAKSFAIENNATGQLAMLIRAETGMSVDHSILKYDGRPFSPSFIAKEVQKEVAATWSK